MRPLLETTESSWWAFSRSNSKIDRRSRQEARIGEGKMQPQSGLSFESATIKNAVHEERRSRKVLRKPVGRIGLALAALLVAGSTVLDAGSSLPNLFPFLDSTGFVATNSTTGSVNLSGPFFQSLGTNGRTCGTCHAPSDGFGLSAIDAQLRYFSSRGKDPLFDQVDGSTCPTGPINNSLVVNSGLIRIGLQVA